MLEAYYSSGCRSKDLFEGLEIENDLTFEEHLNRHPVIYFDLISMMSDFNDDNPDNLGLRKIMNTVPSAEVTEEYLDANVNWNGSLKKAMMAVSDALKSKDKGTKTSNSHKFIVIMDE